VQLPWQHITRVVRKDAQRPGTGRLSAKHHTAVGTLQQTRGQAPRRRTARCHAGGGAPTGRHSPA
jgi:hypothetical protein